MTPSTLQYAPLMAQGDKSQRKNKLWQLKVQRQRVMRQLVDGGWSAAKVAELYGMSRAQVGNIIRACYVEADDA